MTGVLCSLCGDVSRRDIALKDAKWEEFAMPEDMENKYLCRECAKKVAQAVLDDY
ncbi:MAG: hypothetical protein Q7R52_03125 [archaeon]|nr:hypothetical protein [archaeon]